MKELVKKYFMLYNFRQIDSALVSEEAKNSLNYFSHYERNFQVKELC